MNAITLFEHEGRPLRVILIDEEPWFVAADITRALEIMNGREAVSRLDSGDVSLTDTIDSLGRTQRSTILNEAGLYELVLSSRKPAAKDFKRWVTHEVLPTIRKTGNYTNVHQLPAAPPTHVEALRGWADAIERASTAEKHVAELQPKAALVDGLISATGDHAVREAAQILARDHGIQTGERRLFAELRNHRWIDKSNQPYQSHIERGLVALRLIPWTDPDTGECHSNSQVRITPKGVVVLHELLRSAA
jgi:anti-repressor protein